MVERERKVTLCTVYRSTVERTKQLRSECVCERETTKRTLRGHCIQLAPSNIEVWSAAYGAKAFSLRPDVKRRKVREREKFILHSPIYYELWKSPLSTFLFLSHLMDANVSSFFFFFFPPPTSQSVPPWLHSLLMCLLQRKHSWRKMPETHSLDRYWYVTWDEMLLLLLLLREKNTQGKVHTSYWCRLIKVGRVMPSETTNFKVWLKCVRRDRLSKRAKEKYVSQGE